MLTENSDRRKELISIFIEPTVNDMGVTLPHIANAMQYTLKLGEGDYLENEYCGSTSNSLVNMLETTYGLN